METGQGFPNNHIGVQKTQGTHLNIIIVRSLFGGVLVASLLANWFFATQAKNYARLYSANYAQDVRVDSAIQNIEASMQEIAIYRDRIDALTSSTIDRESGDEKNLENKLARVRNGLDAVQNYATPELRILNMDRRADELASQAKKIEQTMRAVAAILTLRKDLLAGVPSITPADGWISSGFGERNSPFTGETVVHKGVDIGADSGTPVYATADGVVELTANSDSYGKLVIIKHPFNVYTKFAHNSSINVVRGQKVRRGDLISHVGSTGHSTGPHLHYEVIVDRQPVNPLDYLLDREFGVNLAASEVAMDSVGGEDGLWARSDEVRVPSVQKFSAKNLMGQKSLNSGAAVSASIDQATVAKTFTSRQIGAGFLALIALIALYCLVRQNPYFLGLFLGSDRV